MKSEIILIRALGPDGGLWCVPWGIIDIASYLQKYGYKVTVLDRANRRFFKILREKIKTQNISYVGISALTSQARDAEFLCKYLKKMKKEAIVGGLHYTILPQDGLEVASFVFKGEGEHSLLDFLENGPKRRIYESEPLLALDEIPLPNEEIISKFYLNKECFTIMSSRGCLYNCSFCLDKKYRFSKIRYHSPGYVCDLLQMLARSFDLRNFFIADDVFATSKERVLEICQGIKKRNLNIKLGAFTHSGIDDLELYKEMKDAGFEKLQIGIESGCNQVLEAMNKKQTVEQVKKTIEIIKKSGLKPSGTFMVGNILESEKSLKDTLALAQELHLTGWVSYAQPFPGTRFYELSSQYGKIVNNNPKTYWNEKVVFLPRGLSRFKLRYYRDKIALALNVPVPLRRKLLCKFYEKLKLPYA